MASLKSKAVVGMLWSAFGAIGLQGISFIIGIILARILMPSDYGLIGMLAIFFAISQIFIDGGFSNALIQKIDRTEEDFSTIFFFNLGISLFFYAILFWTAPLIAKFYNAPELILLTRVLSLNILISAFSIVQQTKLSIDLDFKTPALISFFAVIISGAVGVALAFLRFGVWALVFQTLIASLIRTLALFYFNRWIPKWVFSVASFKGLFGFSSKLLAAGLLGAVLNNLYSIFIGKIFSSRDLGFYTRARHIPEFFSNTITNILQGVTYPILTSLQNERERLVAVYGRLMRVTVFFVIPLLTLLALLAESFIRFFLTEKWLPVVPLIQWLCFAKMITPISTLNMNILNAIGRSDLFFKVDISKTPLTIAALLITIPYGIKAVVIGHFAESFICFFINAYYPGKFFGFGAYRQIKEMKKVFFATICMTVSVIGVSQIIFDDFLKLVLGAMTGVLVFLLSAYLIKIPEFDEVKKMSLQFIEKIKFNPLKA